MEDNELLKEILAELRSMNKKLDKISDDVTLCEIKDSIDFVDSTVGDIKKIMLGKYNK